MSNAKIFVSYSHKDKRFADELLDHLKVIERQGLVSFWLDRDIEAGSEWSSEIKNALDSADMAIVLISPQYLSSEYVLEHELPALIRKAQERRTPLLPILARPTHWTAVPDLAQFQFLNDVAKPLSAARDRDEEWVRITGRIIDLVNQINSSKAGEQEQTLSSKEPRPSIPTSEEPEQHVFLSHSKHDGDFAELLKLRLEAEGLRAWIDTDRLDPGVDWRHEIDDSIRKCLAMVAVMSPAARTSEYVTYEWAFAWGCGKRILPIMLYDTPLHPRLATLHYLDFTNRVARPWTRLYASLRANGV